MECYSIEQAIDTIWLKAPPGIRNFLRSEIEDKWLSLCKELNEDGKPILRGDVALPFMKRMIAVAVADINKQFIEATLRC